MFVSRAQIALAAGYIAPRLMTAGLMVTGCLFVGSSAVLAESKKQTNWDVNTQVERDGEGGYNKTATVTNDKGYNNTYTTSGDRDVTRNEDGSRTVSHDRTTTNEKTGHTFDFSLDTEIVKTENGYEFTSERKGEGSRGGSFSSETNGTVTRNPDGSINRSSTTNGTVTGPRGNETGYTTERNHDSARNDKGGRDFTGSSTTTTENGFERRVDRDGSTWRDGRDGRDGQGKRGREVNGSLTNSNGREANWRSEGQSWWTGEGRKWEGNTVGSDNRGNHWQSNRTGEWRRNWEAKKAEIQAKVQTKWQGHRTTRQSSTARSTRATSVRKPANRSSVSRRASGNRGGRRR